MGFALAREAHNRGARVILIAGPTHVEPPPAVELVRVRSAADMYAAVIARVDQADAVVMAAAVADYTPAGGAAPQKIEKGGPTTIALERTVDILATLGAQRGNAARPVLVGFSATTGDPTAAARKKLDGKHVDLIVANDVTAPGAGFDVETNQVVIVTHEAEDRLPLMSKTAVASVVIDRVERLLAASPALSASR